ncbi:MAG: FAD-dependent oxidoreductase [Woeseiaceae bacterium]|nr:FAD-dependent oxidoreductase [Woeseiaceae bacterium]
MRDQYDVVVVGGGVVGLATAGLLADASRRLKITVVDASTRPPRETSELDLRVSAIANGSIDILDKLGAWDRIDSERRCAYEHMRVWDSADAPDSASALRFDADDFGLPYLGYIVENSAIQRALLHRLNVLGVNVRYGAGIDSIERREPRIVVSLDDGDTISADLLIGADGMRSRVRDCVGIDVTRIDYQQTAIVTHLRPERDHEATAWQRFLPTGPIALLPLADGRVSTVWSTNEPDAALAADDEALGRLLTEASAAVLGELIVDGPRGSFPLNAHHAKNYVTENVALVGDAAHAVHPLAGQGANLGLQDAAMLAHTLAEAVSGGVHPGERRVLRRYERARKGENATMVHALTALNRLFASNLPFSSELRRTGMQLFNVSGPLRERVVERALGGKPMR